MTPTTPSLIFPSNYIPPRFFGRGGTEGAFQNSSNGQCQLCYCFDCSNHWSEIKYGNCQATFEQHVQQRQCLHSSLLVILQKKTIILFLFLFQGFIARQSCDFESPTNPALGGEGVYCAGGDGSNWSGDGQ